MKKVKKSKKLEQPARFGFPGLLTPSRMVPSEEKTMARLAKTP